MSDPDAAPALPREILRLSDLSTRRATDIALTPDGAGRRAIAAALGLSAVEALALTGRLAPQGRRDWHLDARLTARIVQPCIVTLEPVTTDIDAAVTRRYIDGYEEPEGAEVEMPQDDDAEPLPATIDLAAIAAEALGLAAPDYPRRDDTGEVDLTVSAPGVTPLEGEALKPFAGLAGLKARLEGGTDD